MREKPGEMWQNSKLRYFGTVVHRDTLHFVAVQNVAPYVVQVSSAGAAQSNQHNFVLGVKILHRLVFCEH